MKLIKLIPAIFVTIFFCDNDNALGQTYAAPNMIDTMQVLIEQNGTEFRVVNTIPNPDGNFILYRVIGGDDSLAVANGTGTVVKLGTIDNSETGYTMNNVVPFPMYPGQTYWFVIEPYIAFNDMNDWFACNLTGYTDTSLMLYGSITGPVTPFTPSISTGGTENRETETALITWTSGVANVVLTETDDVFVRDMSGRTLWQGRLPQGQHQLPSLSSSGILVISTSSGKFQKIMGL